MAVWASLVHTLVGGACKHDESEESHIRYGAEHSTEENFLHKTTEDHVTSVL